MNIVLFDESPWYVDWLGLYFWIWISYLVLRADLPCVVCLYVCLQNRTLGFPEFEEIWNQLLWFTCVCVCAQLLWKFRGYLWRLPFCSPVKLPTILAEYCGDLRRWRVRAKTTQTKISDSWLVKFHTWFAWIPGKEGVEVEKKQNMVFKILRSST